MGTKIELVRDYPGAGLKGDVVEVGAERAERWCREGIAVLPAKPAARRGKAKGSAGGKGEQGSGEGK